MALRPTGLLRMWKSIPRTSQFLKLSDPFELSYSVGCGLRVIVIDDFVVSIDVNGTASYRYSWNLEVELPKSL